MMRVVLYACAMLCLAAASVAQPPSVAEVEGKVIDAASRLPIAGAKVILYRVDRERLSLGPDLYKLEPGPKTEDPALDRKVTLTGDDGSFRFTVTAPARFRFFADAKGYVRSRTGFGPDDVIYEVKPGAARSGIVIDLPPEATITGRVIDVETGQPVEGLQVMPWTYRVSSGGRFLSPAGNTAKTDAEGRYTIAGVPPGEYLIEARPVQQIKIVPVRTDDEFREERRITYARGFYPGAPRPEEGVSVNMMQGDAAVGIDFKLAKRRTAAIRGRVLGEPAAKVNLTLFSVTASGGARLYVHHAGSQVESGTAFEIENLAPGTYWLQAMIPAGENSTRQFAALGFDVDDRNLDKLDLHLTKGVAVTGRVRLEKDESPPAALSESKLEVSYRPLVRMSAGEEPGKVNAVDLTFRVEGVSPEDYSFYLSGLPKGYKVSGVTYNGTPCFHRVVRMDPAAETHRVEFTIAQATSSLLVTVTDGVRPSAGATAILAAEPMNSSTPDYALLNKQADGEGRVTFDTLLPGTYRLIAFPADALWRNDKDLLAKLAASQEVKIGPNMAATIQIRVLPAP